MPQHSNIRRSPKKHNFMKASSNPAIWSRSQQDWNELPSPRSNNYNSPYKQTKNKHKQRSVDLEEGSTTRGFVSPTGGNFETVTKRKAGTHYNSNQNLMGSFVSQNDSENEYSPPSVIKSGQNSTTNESLHSKHIHPVRKETPRGLQMSYSRDGEEKTTDSLATNQHQHATTSQRVPNTKRDSTGSVGQNSPTGNTEHKFVGSVQLKKDKEADQMDSIIRNFDVTIWRSCEVVDSVGTPSAKHLKQQTMAVTLSCWNYLFSSVGKGFGKQVAWRNLEKILMDRDVFDFTVNNSTVNDILVQWVFTLNNKFGTKCNAFMFYKPVGRNSTTLSGGEALTILQNELNHRNTLFVYHAHDALLIPVGYQVTNGALSGKNEEVTVVVFADPSTGKLLCLPWVDVMTDLECQLPYYYDVKSKSQGLLVNSKATSGNSHCIIAFQDDTNSQFRVRLQQQNNNPNNDNNNNNKNNRQAKK